MAEDFLDAEAATGTTLQNSFVDGPDTLLSNSTAVTFGHQLSSRTRLSFGSAFGYSHLSGSSHPSLSNRIYTGSGGLEHSLSATKTVGVSYSFQQIEASGAYGGTGYHTFSSGYSQQLTPSWRVGLAVGASTGRFLGATRQWSAVGSLSLSRTFSRSNLSFIYSRGHGFSGYVSNGYTDRADLGWGVGISRRMHARIGAGYERNVSTLQTPVASPIRHSAKYAIGQMDYRLSSQLSWFVSYGYKNQLSDDPQLFTGGRNFVSTGIRWYPGLRAIN